MFITRKKAFTTAYQAFILNIDDDISMEAVMTNIKRWMQADASTVGELPTPVQYENRLGSLHEFICWYIRGGSQQF